MSSLKTKAKGARDLMNLLRPARKFNSLINAIDGAMGLIAGVLIFIMTALISFAVILRYVFNRPPTWTFDVCSFLLLAIAMFSGVYTMREDAHISFSIITDKLKPSFRRVTIALGSICGFVYCFVLLEESIRLGLRAIKYKIYAMAWVRLPDIYLFAMITVGALFLLLTFLVKMFAQIFKSDKISA
jgi:TRAP-type C4-dicarboxylate transport system permease small subunit